MQPGGVVWPSWPCTSRAGCPCHVACRDQRRWSEAERCSALRRAQNVCQENKNLRYCHAGKRSLLPSTARIIGISTCSLQAMRKCRGGIRLGAKYLATCWDCGGSRPMAWRPWVVSTQRGVWRAAHYSAVHGLILCEHSAVQFAGRYTAKWRPLDANATSQVEPWSLKILLTIRSLKGRQPEDVAKSSFGAASHEFCSRPASSTSRTLRARVAGVKGFWRKAVFASSTPLRTMASSVYPDM